MLTEERYSVILEKVNQNKSVKLTELCELLGASESTIRRDLASLDEKGLLKKVHGGAVSMDDHTLNLVEQDMEKKSKMFTEEKIAIARYASSLVDDDDFVFIDAGTTTEKMIGFLPDKNVTFVTNAFVHAKKLAQRGFKVYIPAGEIKLTTEAIVGAECVSSLQSYNFTKCFIGANGISLSAGVTTPDRNEASIKAAAVMNSQTAYVLADHSKFDQIAPITFASLGSVKIITDKLMDRKYLSKANIKEVM
ncbi:MAG: DeoR/GlpR family DNA-binding transcription regulator [Lachnospiraceae bacterium]|nr:DeoR/GlpR family DNA-binding transcription regulator [Lachnospiraceae bacterium]